MASKTVTPVLAYNEDDINRLKTKLETAKRNAENYKREMQGAQQGLVEYGAKIREITGQLSAERDARIRAEDALRLSQDLIDEIDPVWRTFSEEMPEYHQEVWFFDPTPPSDKHFNRGVCKWISSPGLASKLLHCYWRPIVEPQPPTEMHEKVDENNGESRNKGEVR